MHNTLPLDLPEQPLIDQSQPLLRAIERKALLDSATTASAEPIPLARIGNPVFQNVRKEQHVEHVDTAARFSILHDLRKPPTGRG